jgi:hypothetical protein
MQTRLLTFDLQSWVNDLVARQVVLPGTGLAELDLTTWLADKPHCLGTCRAGFDELVARLVSLPGTCRVGFDELFGRLVPFSWTCRAGLNILLSG